MQGSLPCRDGGLCPYGEVCDQCPELKVRAEGQDPKNYERGGFFSKEIVKGPDGKYHYTHNE